MNVNATKRVFAVPGFFFIVAACAADENPAMIYSGKFWAGVFLVLLILALALWLLGELGIFQFR